MKITRVEASALSVPVSFSELGVERTQSSSMVYVEIETADGAIGHGISSITQCEVVAEIVNAVAGLLRPDEGRVVTDGVTLMDTVSYEHKQNEANGEENRDGHDHSLSGNWGVGGPSEELAVGDAGFASHLLVAPMIAGSAATARDRHPFYREYLEAFVDDTNGTSSAASPIQNINTPSFDHIAVWAR